MLLELNEGCDYRDRELNIALNDESRASII